MLKNLHKHINMSAMARFRMKKLVVVLICFLYSHSFHNTISIREENLWLNFWSLIIFKEIKSLPQIIVILSQYLCNLMTRKPLIFQTVNSVSENNLSLKYQRVSPSDYKDIDLQTKIKRLIHLKRKYEILYKSDQIFINCKILSTKYKTYQR